MFVPLRTEVDVRRPSVVVPMLVLINALVFIVLVGGDKAGLLKGNAIYDALALGRDRLSWWRPFTYQFLHDPASIWHVLFNMVFLVAFGTAVEARLGRLGMLAFYLIGGAVAGLAHVLSSPAPVIGASGAVAAVTGAYLAFFPRSRVVVFGLFPVLGVFSISAIWVIAIYFGIDVASQLSAWLGQEGRRVAYMAHIAGYVYGFGVAFLLLACGIVARRDVDVFFLFRQWRRRAEMRGASKYGATWHHQRGSALDSPPEGARDGAPNRAANGAQSPAETDGSRHRGDAVDTAASGAARSGGVADVASAVSAGRAEGRSPGSSPREPRGPGGSGATEGAPDGPARAAQHALRAQLRERFSRRDIAGAASIYRELLRLDPEVLLVEGEQLDIANQLLSEGRESDAARAYELYLQANPRTHRGDDVRLLLASVYARRLGDSARARPLLESLRVRLRDPDRLAFAERLLSELAT
ncbi:MAG TPA: rhomboid family intramembrane serine protease [Phycisphaerales bacterium]|nr:rhomboid family intramembrane serine protease [Phycisphaerales bacterium]HMP38384.1 rhomboid family intramembrane serine protease [Phycisphaerales bacterium]